MVSSPVFPSISYGRNSDVPAGGLDKYQVLFQSEDLPAVGRQAMKELSASVQWNGGGAVEKYRDCYAIWPTEDRSSGALVAKLTDAGKDRLGRPHALRIDAVYVDTSALASSPELLARLLQPTAWPPEPWAGPPIRITLTPGDPDPQITKVLQSFIAEHSRLPRLLIVNHCFYRSLGFDIVIDSVAANDRAVVLSERGISPALAPPEIAAARHRKVGLSFALGIMLFGMTGIVAWLGYAHRELGQQLGACQQELTAKKKEHQSTIAAQVRIRRELKSQQQKLQGSQAVLSEAVVRLQNLQHEMIEAATPMPGVVEGTSRANFIRLDSQRAGDSAVQQRLEDWAESLQQITEELQRPIP